MPFAPKKADKLNLSLAWLAFAQRVKWPVKWDALMRMWCHGDATNLPNKSLQYKNHINATSIGLILFDPNALLYPLYLKARGILWFHVIVTHSPLTW